MRKKKDFRTNPKTYLVLIVMCYLVIGILYARFTPDWQIPDEPAHYNYIRQLATRSVPVLEVGDYDQEYQAHLISSGFPRTLPISKFQYEDHQPPLYYLLAIPIYIISQGALFPIRLFSILLGGLLLVVAFRIGRLIFPNQPVITLTAVAFIAFIPQHIAMMAGVNNDSLSELLVALVLLKIVQLLIVKETPRPELQPWVVGVLLGAVFLTKSQAYVTAPVLGIAIMLGWNQRDRDKRWLFRWLLGVFGPAIFLGALWWIRNSYIYGGADFMGLGRHELVVQGQPTTVEWIATFGIKATLVRFFQLTFQSFWGMFGWMGIVMDARIYQALLLLSVLTGIGFLSHLLTHPVPLPLQFPVPYLFALSTTFSVSGYLWYNLGYVQHQGRYLFPALIPLSLAFGLSWNQLAQFKLGKIVAVLCLISALVALLVGTEWFAVFCLGAAIALYGNSMLRIKAGFLSAGITICLLLLCIAGLFCFIIPSLS